MLDTYNDIFVRDNFGDPGIIPSQGNPYASPDIIPYGNAVLDWATANSTYSSGTDLGQPVVLPGTNNVFVRAKSNKPAGSDSATVSLFYMPPSLLCTPNQWIPLYPAGGAAVTSNFVNGTGSTTISAGDVCLSSPAFDLTTALTPNEHYCFCAVVSSTDNPFSKPTTNFGSNAALVAWIQDHPEVGWRNFNVTPNGLSTVATSQIFANENPTGPQPTFLFEFTAPSGFNLPVGTTIMASNADPLCPISQTMTLPAPNANGDQIVSFTNVVPNLYTGTLGVTISAPAGTNLPVGAHLDISAYQVPLPPELELELVHRVLRPIRGARVHADGSVAANELLIPLGRVTYQFGSN